VLILIIIDKQKKLKTTGFLIIALALIIIPLSFIKAQITDELVDVTADDIGYSEEAINNADEESTIEVEQSGTLIEIGNTTAEETTIIVRIPDSEDGTVDETLQVNTKTTSFINEDGEKNDLSYWIAGDVLKFKAKKNLNSGELIASQIRNRAMRKIHKGKNGWIKEIRTEENEIDVTWANKIFTLNLNEARMVAGLKNPASITDLKVDDRIRARVVEDNDGNDTTWNAKIVVVLRRGQTLFMRVTRWVVPGQIISIPDDINANPTTITVEILPSKFFQKGDVNNLIGAPGKQLEINITKNTDLRRKFLGKCFLNEFSEGDNILIIGRLNEETGHLDAKAIKNNTIQRLGVSKVISTVTQVNEASVEVTLKNGQKYTILANTNTKILKRGQNGAKICIF